MDYSGAVVTQSNHEVLSSRDIVWASTYEFWVDHASDQSKNQKTKYSASHSDSRADREGICSEITEKPFC